MIDVKLKGGTKDEEEMINQDIDALNENHIGDAVWARGLVWT